jgi:hypothetical protein
MEVVFQGRLTSDQDIRDVLNDLLALTTGDLGILRISSSNNKVSGRLVIQRRQQVIGAQIPDTGEFGYPALRKLLSVRQGAFAYVDLEGQPLKPEDENVKVDVRTLIELLPNLPDELPSTGSEPKTRVSREYARVVEAAELIREATHQVSEPEHAPDQILKLRELQKRGTLLKTLITWGIVALAAFAIWNVYGKQIQTTLQSKQLLRDLDKKTVQVIRQLSGSAPTPPPAPTASKSHSKRGK